MLNAQTKLTSQGQVSVPAAVRQMLGLTPGSVLEWQESDGQIVVRRAARATTQDLVEALFPYGEKPKRSTDADIKKSIGEHLKKKHAGR